MISRINDSGAMSAMSGMRGMSGARPSAEQIFSRMDGNQDGSVDKAEFSEMSRQMASSPMGRMEGAPSSDEIFSKIDTDGNGSLSKAETSSFHQLMEQKMGSLMASGGSTASGGTIDSLLEMLDNSDSKEKENESSLSRIAQSYSFSGQSGSLSLLDLIG